jgi:preprotein translocase subunit YajC
MGEFVAFSTILLILMGAYYSFIILPRQRLFKQHNRYVRTLAPGEEVITAGGLIGTLISMDPEAGVAYVKIAEGVEVKVLTTALSRPFVAEEIAQSAQIGVEAATPTNPR